MSVTNVSPAEILQRARELYEANPSHAPSHHCPADDECCAVQALSRAGASATWAAEDIADQAFFEAMGGDEDSIVDYNAGHSTEEVIATFDRAIELVSA